MSTQTEAVGQRAVRAVLERVASSIENELPTVDPDLIMSGEGTRMHRLEHNELDEPVYVLVTARALTTAEARRFMPGGDGDTDTKPRPRCEQDAHQGFGRGPCGQPLDSRGQCGRANMHTGS